jgi:hypothetical protein
VLISTTLPRPVSSSSKPLPSVGVIGLPTPAILVSAPPPFPQSRPPYYSPATHKNAIGPIDQHNPSLRPAYIPPESLDEMTASTLSDHWPTGPTLQYNQVIIQARTWQSWQGDLGISAGLSLIPRRGESPGFNVLERVDVNDSNKLDYAGLRVSSKPVLQIHVDTCNAESRPIINSQYH